MSERIGVIRENGVVVNTILWADHTPDQLRADGITDFEEVTDLEFKPGIGWTWNEADGFRPPQPYPSWNWDGAEWVAPTPKPTDGERYLWNEDTQTWDEIPTEEPAP
jgi:hypothetical protein